MPLPSRAAHLYNRHINDEYGDYQGAASCLAARSTATIVTPDTGHRPRSSEAHHQPRYQRFAPGHGLRLLSLRMLNYALLRDNYAGD
jgi:hypothetical protein